jgi:DNA-binding response OmpR family regulator
MGLSQQSRARFNLSKAAILLFDPTPMGMSILVQIVTGLGAKQLYRCTTLEEAREAVSNFEMHLMIIDSLSQTGEGYDFVRWLRREGSEPNVHAPVLLTAAHTRVSDVNKARDCGSHFIVAKPIAPIVMLERIIWVSKEGRGFLLADEYVGPDRRFHDVGPPPSRIGLRRGDPVPGAPDPTPTEGPITRVQS